MQTSSKDRNIAIQGPASEALRIDLYALLAFLLARPPQDDELSRLAALSAASQIHVSLARALHALRNAARQYNLKSVRQEYEDLFIGMGRGEIVPYASWYAEKLLLAGSLVRLRTDLRQLNIQRQAGVCEPEDHAAALCETMVLILRDTKVAPGRQASFFNTNLAPWMIRFFRDLQKARSVRFYRCVGRLGEQFMLLEKQLLQEKHIEEN